MPDEAFWRYCGRNSGNLLYRFACPSAAALALGVDLLSSEIAAAALRAADVVVMPMANLLRDAARGPLPPELLEETRFAHDLARSLRAAGKGLLLCSLGYEGLADATEAQLHPAAGHGGRGLPKRWRRGVARASHGRSLGAARALPRAAAPARCCSPSRAAAIRKRSRGASACPWTLRTARRPCAPS